MDSSALRSALASFGTRFTRTVGRRPLVWGTVALLVVSVLLLVGWKRRAQPPPSKVPQVGAPTPTPTPTRLVQGKETYTISQPKTTKGPKVTKLTVDPHDPKVGDQQTIEVEVVHPAPVSAVTVTIDSDNTTRTLTATRAAGSATSNQWAASWTVDDTVLYRYRFTVRAAGAGEESEVVVAPRS